MSNIRASRIKTLQDPRLTINVDLSGEDGEVTLEVSSVTDNGIEEQYVNVKRLSEIVGQKAVDRFKLNLQKMLDKVG